MATVAQIMDALATQIQTTLSGTVSPVIENLQVDGRLVPSPTPPAIDIYPSDPFQDALTFGKGHNMFFITVRARVSTADNEGGQELLLSMMDPEASTSMLKAILSSKTLGGVVSNISIVDGPSAYGVFRDAGGQGSLLGCTWGTRVIP